MAKCADLRAEFEAVSANIFAGHVSDTCRTGVKEYMGTDMRMDIHEDVISNTHKTSLK